MERFGIYYIFANIEKSYKILLISKEIIYSMHIKAFCRIIKLNKKCNFFQTHSKLQNWSFDDLFPSYLTNNINIPLYRKTFLQYSLRVNCYVIH